jgi:hypothetical protein
VRGLAPERRKTCADLRARKLEQKVTFLGVAPCWKVLRCTREQLGCLLERQAPRCALRTASCPGDRLIGWNVRDGREQMLHGLGERGVGIVTVSIEQYLGGTCVKLRTARRGQVLAQHLADQDMGKRGAIAGLDEHVATHRLRGEIAHGRERQIDKRRNDAEVERSPEH